MRLQTVFLSLAAFALFFELAITSKFEKQPKELDLQQLLKEHGISWGEDDNSQLMRESSYKRTASAQNKPLVSTCELDYCKIPEDKNVVVLKNNRSIPFTFSKDFINVFFKFLCRPREMIVRVLAAPFTKPFPYYVSLHRCVGSLYAETYGYHCKVKEKEEIKVNYIDFYSRQHEVSTMFNHTKCAYECYLRQEDCNVNETLDRYKCRCECTLTASHCNKDQFFDKHDCECKCKVSLKDCNKPLMKRNKDCKCECDPRIKKICFDYNMQIDPTYCTCV